MRDISGVQCLVTVVLGLMLAAVLVAMSVHNAYRSEAIDHGAAEWRFDPKTGATEFVWLTDKKESR